VGPLVRKNCDIVVMQPIYDSEARDVIHKLYGAHWDKKDFAALVDSVVIDEDLPESTPQEPVKRVRTLVINSYRNTIDPSQRFKYWEASDPGKFRLCHPKYWKEQDNDLGGGKGPKFNTDPVEELEQVSLLASCRL
jgi:hypothetical protein